MSSGMKATELLLSRMVRRHGNYSATARALGLIPRCLRRTRRASNTPTRRIIVLAGKLYVLRELLSQLRAAGAVTDDDLRSAWEAMSSSETPSPKPAPRATSVSKLGRRHNASA